MLQVRRVRRPCRCTSPSSSTSSRPSPNLAVDPASFLTSLHSTRNRREYPVLQGRLVRDLCRCTSPSFLTTSRPSPNLAFDPVSFLTSRCGTRNRKECLVLLPFFVRPPFPVSPNSAPVLTLLTKEPEKGIHLVPRVLEIRRILCGEYHVSAFRWGTRCQYH